MVTLEELEKRVEALEAGVKTDVMALKRDIRRMLSLQDDTLEQLEALNQRIVANELTATANARTTEKGFANLQTQMDGLRGEMRQQIGALDSRVARVETGLAEVKADVAGLRRDLPGMMTETLREFFAEKRGE